MVIAPPSGHCAGRRRPGNKGDGKITDRAEITYENGIKIKRGKGQVSLDPKRKSANPIVSHGHTDHLARDGIMTHPTKDVMKIRKNWDASLSLSYGEKLQLDDLEIIFRDAGHVLGSAMVRVDDILYTGDFNPEGGLTCGSAKPEKCKALIVESTYGKPQYSLPDKNEVEHDFIAWASSVLEEGSIIASGYEFGKAQELVALLNKSFRMPVHVPQSIARICDIYRKHGIELEYRLLPDEWFEHRFSGKPRAHNGDLRDFCGGSGSGRHAGAGAGGADEGGLAAGKKAHECSAPSRAEAKEPMLVVLPPGWLRYGSPNYWQVHKAKKNGFKASYASGWCAFHRGTGMDTDAAFPLSDHADFDDIMEFVARCSPERVYTVYGSSKELAREIKKELGIDAESLDGGGGGW